MRIQDLMDQHFLGADETDVDTAGQTKEADAPPETQDLVEAGVQTVSMLKEAAALLREKMSSGQAAAAHLEGEEEFMRVLREKLSGGPKNLPAGGKQPSRQETMQVPRTKNSPPELASNESILKANKRDLKRHSVSPLQAAFGYPPAKPKAAIDAIPEATQRGLKYASADDELRALLEV